MGLPGRLVLALESPPPGGIQGLEAFGGDGARAGPADPRMATSLARQSGCGRSDIWSTRW